MVLEKKEVKGVGSKSSGSNGEEGQKRMRG